jgi:hypothetical protein
MKLSRIMPNSVHRAKGASIIVTPFLTVFFLAVSLVSTTSFVPSITQYLAAESQLPASVAPSGSNPIVPASRGIPLVFIENVGQFDERIHFQARSGHTTLLLTNDALWLRLTEPSSKPDPISGMEVPDAVGTETVAERGVNLRLSFVGANARPRLEPFEERDALISFFTGCDPDQWQTHVPAWGGVRYEELYPGVDLEITSQNGQLAPRLVVREHSSLRNVRLRVEGADDLALEGNYLHLTTPLGDFALPLVSVEGSRPDAQPSIFNVGRGTFQVSSPFASAPMSADVSAQDFTPSLRDGLLVYYSFDTDEGGIVTDESGSGNDGTVVGTPTYTTQGRFGGAYYFAAESGSGCCSWYRDYVVLNGNPTANLEQFAISLWFKTDHPEFNYKIASAADWPPGSGWVVGTQYPEAWSDDGNSIRYGSRTRSVDPIAGTWNHMVVSYDGTTFKEHINGQLSREWPTTGLPLGDANRQSLAVAAWPQHGFGYDGLIDELRIYSRALSADEVSRLYDPGWSYSTYLGGSCEDRGYDIAVDNTGNVYITGQIASVDFPTTPGAYDPSNNDDPPGCQISDYTGEAFITKLSADGSTLLFSTYLGGNSEDAGYGIAVDSTGSVYLVGKTYSIDFPTTPGALDADLNGGRDVFVAKLNATGDDLIYSTYLGGNSWEYGLDIAVDGQGYAYVTGFTHGDFPTTPGVIQPTPAGSIDPFVVKLNLDGSELVYSTYLGGSWNDGGDSIVVDSNGGAYVTGGTGSLDFPTANPLQPNKAGGTSDAFVAKLNADGSDLVYSTYLGGSTGGGGESGYGIVIDSAGNAYVTGATDATDFPTVDPLQPAYGGGELDAFLFKLNDDGSALVYSTYLGGSGLDRSLGIGIDAEHHAYITGYTSSPDMTTVHPLQAAKAGGYDVFLAKVNYHGNALLYSTYLGGSEDENCYGPGQGDAGLAVNGAGKAYLTGLTSSSDFPTSAGAFDTSFSGGDSDVFVTSLDLGPIRENRIFLPLILR